MNCHFTIAVFATLLAVALLPACGCDSDDNDSGNNADEDNGDLGDDDADDDVDDDATDDDADDDTDFYQNIVLESDALRMTIHPRPFGWRLESVADKALVTQTLGFGSGESFFYFRGETRHGLYSYIGSAHEAGAVSMRYRTTEGTEAKIRFAFDAARELRVETFIDPAPGNLSVGQDLALADDEAIYGAVERISWDAWTSERNPTNLGSLDRRGQWHSMIVQGTIGVYTPFFHSSAGYGLYVDTTFYGEFDFGATAPDRLRFHFRARGDRSPVQTFRIFFGPSHDDILDAYTALTGRPLVPPDWAFRHWRWRDEHERVTGDLDGRTINGEVAEDINQYEALEFPFGNYMIDRPYTPGEQGFAEFSWDPDRFPNAADMVRSFEDRDMHLIIWGAPWAIGDEPGQNGAEAQALGYLAPGSPDHIDFTNPDACEWWKDKLVAWVTDNSIHGWKLDRGDETQPSLPGEIYFDGRGGEEVRNHYPVLYQRCYFEAMQEAWGDDFVSKARAGWAGSQQYVILWGGDTRGNVNGRRTDLGLRSAILSMLHAAFMGYPVWGSDTGGYQEFRDREVFARWLQFSAFTPLMEIGGQGAHAPWDMPTDPAYDEELIDIYRTYTTLHHDLVDYLRAQAEIAGETGRPIARPLVFDHPDDPTVKRMWDEYMLGPDLLVAPVWESGARGRDVYIPAGEFVDYWSRDEVTGPTTVAADAPLDRIPLYVRKGATIFGETW
ncbi:MAG: glycoside hydrolase family 31 protein [Deltaproteobacteria bacterium]|nr:glycoside hydrolase family 31 protein [Deltaproteobacteria bacterium]